MASHNHDDQARSHVVETASATTSPDNARSGHFAYVIALVTVCVLAVIGTGMAGCTSLFMNLIEDEFYDYDRDVYDQLYDEREYDDFDEYLDEYLERIYNNDLDRPTDSFGTSPLDENGTITVKEALESELGIYNATIDVLLPANAYANAQGTVRTFVRDLVIADRDASSQIASALRVAAWSDESPSQALAEATDQAEEMVKRLQAMEFPQVEGDKASEVSRNLEIGRGKAIDRWKAIVAELELLASSEELDARDVRDADEQVSEAAQDAADAFTQALADAGSH